MMRRCYYCKIFWDENDMIEHHLIEKHCGGTDKTRVMICSDCNPDIHQDHLGMKK